MIVHDLDILGAVIPAKADAELVVDPDTPSPRPISSQCFKAVARRSTHVFNPSGQIELLEPANDLIAMPYSNECR